MRATLPAGALLDYPKVIGVVAGFFEDRDRPWALIGAAGLTAYGLSRSTQDLDFLTERAIQDELVAHLEAAGFRTLHRSPGYSNHLHADPDLGRVDFVYVDEETGRRMFPGCRVSAFRGHEVRIPRPEHLAALKVHAMKNDPARTLQDLADIRFLLGLPGVDEAEIRGYFEKAGLRDRFDELKRLS